MPKVIAIIQARLGSQRFPLKVLQQIPPESGVSMLELVVRKVCLAQRVDEVVITTPDRMIAVMANRWNVPAYAWPWKERDVLKEYYHTALMRNCKKDDMIVRVTADCPLIRPEIIDEMVKNYLNDPCDLVYNTDCADSDLVGDGFDVECFPFTSLEKAYNKAVKDEREHVCAWMRRHLNKRRVEMQFPVDWPCSINTQKEYFKICRYIQQL